MNVFYSTYYSDYKDIIKKNSKGKNIIKKVTRPSLITLAVSFILANVFMFSWAFYLILISFLSLGISFIVGSMLKTGNFKLMSEDIYNKYKDNYYVKFEDTYLEYSFPEFNNRAYRHTIPPLNEESPIVKFKVNYSDIKKIKFDRINISRDGNTIHDDFICIYLSDGFLNKFINIEGKDRICINFYDFNNRYKNELLEYVFNNFNSYIDDKENWLNFYNVIQEQIESGEKLKSLLTGK